MAEYAEEQLEQQLPELQELTVSGLLSSEEVSQLLRRRRGLEYRLQKREKRLRDLQAYTQHEVSLLLLLKHRRHAAHYYFKRDRIEAAIVQRLHRLHRQACYRFQERLDCWLGHVRFCEMVGQPQQASKVLARMLQVHSGREELWLAAADWHWHERLEARARWLRRKEGRVRRKRPEEEAAKEPEALGATADPAAAAAAAAAAAPARATAAATEVLQSAQLARAFLLRGLRVHKGSRRLLLALLRLEAQLTAWVTARRDDLPPAAGLDADSVVAGEPATLVLAALLKELAACAGGSGCREQRLLLDEAARAAAEAGAEVGERLLAEVRARLELLPAMAEEEEDQQMATLAVEDAADVADPEAAAEGRLLAAMEAGGLAGLRTAWAEMSSDFAARPPPVGALRRYAQLESSAAAAAADESAPRVRLEFERLASRLGRDSVAFWTAFLDWEEASGDSALVGQLDWRARKFLRPELLAGFNAARLCPALCAV